MFYQKFGSPESLFNFEMVRDNGLSCYQCIPRRGLDVRTYRCDANDIISPADARRHQEPGFFALIFKNLAKFGFETRSGQTGRLCQQFRERRALKRKNSKLRQNFLLANPKF